jgi:hypothetical protein
MTRMRSAAAGAAWAGLVLLIVMGALVVTFKPQGTYPYDGYGVNRLLDQLVGDLNAQDARAVAVLVAGESRTSKGPPSGADDEVARAWLDQYGDVGCRTLPTSGVLTLWTPCALRSRSPRTPPLRAGALGDLDGAGSKEAEENRRCPQAGQNGRLADSSSRTCLDSGWRNDTDDLPLHFADDLDRWARRVAHAASVAALDPRCHCRPRASQCGAIRAADRRLALTAACPSALVARPGLSE